MSRARTRRWPFWVLLVVMGLATVFGLLRGWMPTRRLARKVELPRLPDGVSMQRVRVVDGDTIEGTVAGRRETVRLLNINTPEVRQVGFADSKAALIELVDNAPLTLSFELSNRPGRDRYGRLLAYVWVGPTLVNAALVEQGWSRYWRRFGPGRYPGAFEAAERQARERRAGLWSAEGWRPDLAKRKRADSRAKRRRD